MIPPEAIAAAAGVELELAQCVICGSDAAQEIGWGRDRLCGQPGEFRIVKCENCSLVYLNPRPTSDALVAFYPCQYPPHQPVLQRGPIPCSGIRRWAKAWTARWYARALDFDPGQVHQTLRRIEEFPPHFVFGFFPTRPDGRLLDVGCGSGVYLDAFRKLGWDAYGVELSPEAAEQARRSLGLNVFTGVLGDAKFPDGYFDVVTLIHVLEHLRDPVETMREVTRILKKDGLVLMALPNLRSLAAWIFRSYWFPLDVPRHLYHFSPSSLGRLLTKVDGIRLKKVNHLPVTIGFTESWAYLCRDYPFLGKLLPEWLISRLAPPVAWAAALARVSDSIVVYAKKVA